MLQKNQIIITAVVAVTIISVVSVLSLGSLETDNGSALYIKGIWDIKVIDENGNVIDERHVENIVTKNGMDRALQRITGGTYAASSTGGFAFGVLALGNCGTDATCTTPTINDTALEGPIKYVSSSSNLINVGGPAILTFIVPTTTAEETYREAGLVTSTATSVASADGLLNRVTFTPVVKPASATTIFQVTLTLSNAP